MVWALEQLDVYKLFEGYPEGRALPAPALFYFLYMFVVHSRGRHLNVQDLMSCANPSEDSVHMTLRRLWPVVRTLYRQEVSNHETFVLWKKIIKKNEERGW